MKKDKIYQTLEIDVINLAVSDIVATSPSGWMPGEDEMPWVPAS